MERLEQIWESRPGLLGWLTTTDHKRVGLLYFWTTLVFFGAGGAEALIMRTQLAQANNDLVSLMIGARDMAFPRMNALSFWIFLASGIFLYTSLFMGTAPDAGWFNYV